MQRHGQDHVSLQPQVRRQAGQLGSEEVRQREAMAVFERVQHGLDRKRVIKHRTRRIERRPSSLAAAADAATTGRLRAHRAGGGRMIRQFRAARRAHRLATSQAAAHETLLGHQQVGDMQQQAAQGIGGV